METEYWGLTIEILFNFLAMIFMLIMVIICLVFFKVIRYNIGTWIKFGQFVFCWMIYYVTTIIMAYLLESEILIFIVEVNLTIVSPLFVFTLIVLIKKKIHPILSLLILVSFVHRLSYYIWYSLEPYIYPHDVMSYTGTLFLHQIFFILILTLFIPLYMSYDIWVSNKSLRIERRNANQRIMGVFNV